MLEANNSIKDKWKNCFTYIVIGLVPITNKNSEISSRFREWNRNQGPAENPDASKATSCLLKANRWEVKIASDLIFHL